MSVRKTLPVLLLTTALALSGAGCGDKTVTSSPPATRASVGPANASANDGRGAVDTAEADLTEVDQLLRDIEGDLSAVDKDASTPEGDPSQ